MLKLRLDEARLTGSGGERAAGKRVSEMTVKDLCGRLGWNLICGSGEKEVSGCYIGDLLSRVMGNCGESDIWITVQTSRNMIAVAVLADAAAVLLPEGIHVSEEVIRWAEQEDVTLAGCGTSAFSAAVSLAGELGMI
ncbi:hypothetical protein [Bacilliculturomica massiliensis]|uniref:hypothetical protein n=1 Tax=Bacilliculturomica massiliensis TaxID=1917867 RepID=UPI00102F9829|nr:hypothetical protein [Bacilliculturomica massiliensis]